MKLYKIRNWGKFFENNRTRELKQMAWVPIPNKHDGDCYTALASQKNGAALLGAWLVILQVASKCEPRGTLMRGHKIPHTSESLSRMTRISESDISNALKFCSQSIDWIEAVEFTESPQEDAVISQEDASESQPPDEERMNGKEVGNGMKEVVEKWNSQDIFPKCVVLNADRKKTLGARLKEDFFTKNWEAGIERIKASSFCSGKNNRGWKANFEWFISPAALPNIMEGKYDDRKAPEAPVGGRY